MIALALVMVGASTAMAQDPNLLSCQTMPMLMKRYESLHIDQSPRADMIRGRAAGLYVEGMDSSRVLMLDTEVKELRAELEAFYKDVKPDTCALIPKLRQRQVQASQDMLAFVKKTVGAKGFKVDGGVKLQVDPDLRQQPTTAAERDELRRQVIHFQLANYIAAGDKPKEAVTKLIKRYELVVKRIGEQSDPDIYTGLLNAWAAAYDPHTSYFSVEDLEDFRISMALSLDGIGAVLRAEDGYTVIHEIVPGGAADRQGQLKPGDKVTAVSQGPKGEPVDTLDMSLRDVVRMIRGQKGTQVRLTVLRQGDSTETLNILITRDKIDLKQQAAKLRWEQVKRDGKEIKLAVLTLPSFYGGSGGRECGDDVRNLLREAREGGAEGLLLDLSENGGGLLNQAVDIAGFFIKTGSVVGVKGGDDRLQELRDLDPAIYYNGPMVVLTSRLSASASEIVSGALKDYHRAVIVGDDSTFGKGTVQNVVNLPPGLGALKVTTAMFYRPGGKSTQKLGVEADVVVSSPFNLEKFGEASTRYPLPAQIIADFRSKDINATGDQSWVPVSEDQIKELSKRSAQRVQKDKELQEVIKDLDKAKADKGVVAISDILKDKKAAKKDEEDKKDKDKPTPQAKEGLEVLADLVQLQSSQRAAFKQP